MKSLGESDELVFLCYACNFSERFQFFQNKKVSKIWHMYLSPPISSTKSDPDYSDAKLM